MSLILRGIKGIGSAIYATPSAIVQGGQNALQMAYAAPSAVKNTTVQIASTAANGALRIVSSTATAAKNTTIQLATAAASGVKKGVVTTFQYGANGAVGLFNAGKDAAVARTVQNYAELFFRIQNVGQALATDISEGKTVSQVNRNELAERLDEYIDLYNPSAENKVFLTRFCAELRNSSMKFDITMAHEMAHLEQLLAPHFYEHSGYLFSKIAERQQLEKQPGLTTVPAAKLSKKETLEGIQGQLDLLKSNSIKLVLGSIILNMTLGMYTLEGIDFEALKINCNELGIALPDGKNTNLVNFLIEVSNNTEIEGKSSEEVFKLLVYRVIDNSGRNIFVRTHAKFRCNYLFSWISGLVGNLLNNLKDTLVHFAKLPPAEQLEEITKLLINPLVDHLTAIENGQPVPPTVATDSPLSKFWAALFKHNKPGQKTSDELLDQFIEAFLTQFLDPIYQPWTRKARMDLIEKAARSTYLVKALYLTLVGLLWVAGKIIAPFQWTLNETIHFILRKIIVGICPSLSSATKDTLEIGTDHAWYSLKSSLLTMLQQIRLNSLLPRTEDPVFQPPKQIPAEVTAKLNTLLDKLFKVLAIPGDNPDENTSKISAFDAVVDIVLQGYNLQDASLAQAELNEFLANDGKNLVTVLQKNMHGPLLGMLKDLIKTSVTDLALDMCAQDGFINEILLSSLTSTNANGFVATSPTITPEEKRRIAEGLHKELGILGENILVAVNDANRTDKSTQTDANVFITTLKQEVQNFQKSLLSINENADLSFKSHAEGECLSFANSLNLLRGKIQETVDASTQALLLPHVDEALGRIEKIVENLTRTQSIEEVRKQVEAKLDELSTYLEMPLDNEEEIEAILLELMTLNPSFLDVNALIKDLNDNMDIYIERLKSPKGREQHPRAHAKPFPLLMAVYKDKANKTAQTQIKEFKKSKIESSLVLADLFVQWANELKFVKVTSKPTFRDAGFAVLFSMPIVNSLTSSAIQAYGKNLFTFIGDEKNLAGIAQRGMEAYLNKPQMMPKKRRPKFAKLSKNKVKTSEPGILSLRQLAKLNKADWAVLNFV